MPQSQRSLSEQRSGGRHAPEAPLRLHKSYCLVIPTFSVRHRLWGHFRVHEHSLSLSFFVNLWLCWVSVAARSGSSLAPASGLRIVAPPLRAEHQVWTGVQSLRLMGSAAPPQVGPSRTRQNLCPLPWQVILNRWTARGPTVKVSFINLIHKLFTKPDFLTILFTLSTNCKLGPLTQLIFPLS